MARIVCGLPKGSINLKKGEKTGKGEEKFLEKCFSSRAKEREREIPLVGARFWLQNEQKWALQGHFGLPVTFPWEIPPGGVAGSALGCLGAPVSMGLSLGVSSAKEF